MSANNANFPSSVWDGSSPSRAANFTIDRAPDYEDYDQIRAEVIAVQHALVGELTESEGAGATVAAAAPAVTTAGKVYSTTFTFDELEITATMDANAAGGTKIFDFPEGNLLLLGVVGNLVFTAGAGIDADAAMVASIGTAAATNADATLTSTEADIVASIAATLMSSTYTADIAKAAVTYLDGTGGAKDVYVNVAVPDADVTATGVVSVTGSLTFTWLNLGDN